MIITGLKFPSRCSRQYGQIIFISKCGVAAVSFVFFTFLCVSLTFPYCIIAQFFLGALFAHMVELQHEALHGATKKIEVNRLIGFFLGLPMLISYSDYQYHHMIHHQAVGTDKDSEYFEYDNKNNFTLKSFIINMFMSSHYKNVVLKIIKSFGKQQSDAKAPKIRHRIKKEYQAFALILIGVLSASFFFHTLIFLKVWIIPLLSFAVPLHYLIEFPEHVFCEKNNPVVFKNTRTIKSNWLMSWFVNGNNYHVEHHYMPDTPISLLQDLHPELKQRITYYEYSYTQFYRDIFKKLMENKRRVK